MDDFRKVNVFKIGEICNKIHSGGTPSTRNKEEYYGGNIPWLRSGEINFNSITNTEMFITELAIKNSSAKWIRNKSVLIALTGATVARTCVNEITLTANQSCCALETNESIINYKYLYYYLASKYFEIKGMAQGALTSLNLDLIKKITVPVPKIKVQEEIVKILDSFTNLIDALNEELSLRQKQFEYYREKLLTFDETVERLSFGNDFSLKARIGWQGLTKKEYRKSGDYYLITGTDFKDGNQIDFSRCVYVDEERYRQDPSIQIKPNDVLITKDGTLGKVAFIEKMDKPATLNGGVFVVRSKVDGVIPKYVAYYLSSSIFKNWIEQNHTNGSIMHLTQKLLVKFEIAIPSIEVQQSIVEKLDAFESLISSLKEEIALRQKQYEYYREKLLTFE